MYERNDSEPTELPACAIDVSESTRVLVVDADADTRSLYHEALRLSGCDVIESADGRDALAKALIQPPALVVTELRLPFVDGFALCDILRRDRMTATIPILVVTGEARQSELQRAGRRGADAVLVKPIVPGLLVTKTRELLAKPADAPPGSAETSRADSPYSSVAVLEADRAPAKPLVKTHLRCVTTTPPAPPPELRCPSCEGPLRYERSYIGGVSSRHPEQWDELACACGTFEYRHRTRKLRRVQ